MLVTTDIWARGIDVQTVGLVVNYDLPQTAAVYLHRIGRSGRFGRRGLAISFVASADDATHLNGIGKTYSIAIGPAPANLSELTRLPEKESAKEEPPPKAIVVAIKRPAENQQILDASSASTTKKKKRRKLKLRKKEKKQKDRSLKKSISRPDL